MRLKIHFDGRRAEEEVLEISGRFIGVTRIGIADSRQSIPRLVNQTAHGKVFVIQNARNPSAPKAFLLSAAVLEAAIMTPRPRRTLFDLIESLPMRVSGDAIPDANMPDDFLPDLT